MQANIKSQSSGDINDNFRLMSNNLYRLLERGIVNREII